MAVSVVVIVVLILAFLLVRRSKATTNKRTPRPTRPVKMGPDQQFHAVSLEFPSGACDAAQAIAGKRFLANAAPRIPLAECDVAECKCHYIHHKDRRTGSDRRKMYRPVNIGDTGVIRKERRYRGDRRNNDPEDFFS